MGRTYASTELAKARNTYVTATNYDEDMQETDFDVATPEGVQVFITHVPLEDGRKQFSIFINTESWDEPEVDGNPPLQIILNDAVLHDQEPAR